MKKRTILLIVLLAIAAAIAVAAFMWNKGPETVDNKQGLPVSATKVADEYGKDETKANAAYLNKVLEVTGTVAEVTRNQDGKTVLLLQSSDPLSGVQCTMRENGVSAEVGKTVTVKGFCNGYTMVVLISDCVLK